MIGKYEPVSLQRSPAEPPSREKNSWLLFLHTFTHSYCWGCAPAALPSLPSPAPSSAFSSLSHSLGRLEVCALTLCFYPHPLLRLCYSVITVRGLFLNQSISDCLSSLTLRRSWLKAAYSWQLSAIYLDYQARMLTVFQMKEDIFISSSHPS